MGYRHEGSWKALKVLGVLLAGMLAIGGGVLFYLYGIPGIRLSYAESQYKDQLQKLFDRTQSVITQNHEEAPAARRPGKALWIVAHMQTFGNRKWDLHVDERMFSLPSSMRPAGPDDVHAVVLVFSSSEKTGQYVTKDPKAPSKDAVDAYVQKAEVLIVDLDHKMILGQKTFVAEQRKHIVLVADSPVAQLDDAVILDWYLSLPE